MKKTLLLLAMVLPLCGCAAYSKTGDWTPNGFNYTLSRDRETGQFTDYWGLSWNLK